MKNFITIVDNVFSDEKNEELYNFILNSPFYYGEYDNKNTPPTGLTFDIKENSIINFFENCAIQKMSELKNYKRHRIYVNLFISGEIPYFHVDGDKIITCLFYLNPEYSLDEGGETQFFINDQICGIQSKPKRMVIFDGNILHRATSFRNYCRITVALKFEI